MHTLYQPLLVPFGMGGPTPDYVAAANAARTDGGFTVSSLDAQEGPRVLAESSLFAQFLREHPQVELPVRLPVSNPEIAAYHGFAAGVAPAANPAGLSTDEFHSMWERPDTNPELARRFLAAREGTARDPAQLWSGIAETLPGQEFYFRHLLHVLTMAQIVQEQVLDILNASMTPIIIGGDHSINLGVMAGVALYLQQHGLAGGLDTFWVDAHADANTVATSLSHNIHGMPVAALLGLGPQSPGAQVLANLGGVYPKVRHPRWVTQVGLRDVDDEERETLDTVGIDWYSSDDFNGHDGLSLRDTATRHIDKNPHGHTVFSLDLDGLDPQYAPSVTTDVHAGLSLPRTLAAMRTLQLHGGPQRIMAYEIHEFNPVRRGPDGNPTLHADQNRRTIRTILSLLRQMVRRVD